MALLLMSIMIAELLKGGTPLCIVLKAVGNVSIEYMQ